MSAEAIVLCVPDKLVLAVGRREASVHCSMDFQIRLWEFSWHGNQASSRGSCLRECKTEATMSSNGALDVTHCPFLSTLLVTKLALFSVRDDYTSMCAPVGKDNSEPSQRMAVTGTQALDSQPHQLLAPYLLSSVKWGYLHGVVRGVYGVDIKPLVQCSALNKCSINLWIWCSCKV